jgi:hypothetical protein
VPVGVYWTRAQGFPLTAALWDFLVVSRETAAG